MFKVDRDNLKLKYVIGCHKDFETYPDKEDVLFDIISYCNQNNVNEVPKKFFEKNYDLDIFFLLEEIVNEELLKEEDEKYVVLDSPFK